MEILNPQHPSPSDQEFLRNSTHIFWDVDKTKLDFQRHYRSIITLVLNYGSFEDIQHLFRIYKEDAIKEVLIHPIRGEWFPRTYRAFCNLFDIPLDEKAFNILHIGKKAYHGMDNIFKNL
jgi:FMN phosphatase YigB (HAD superfamily)